jgi:hypothetical protein
MIVVICPTAQEKNVHHPGTTGSLRMRPMHHALHVIASASEAIKTVSAVTVWIASSLSLLAMTTILSAIIPGREAARPEDPYADVTS